MNTIKAFIVNNLARTALDDNVATFPDLPVTNEGTSRSEYVDR